MMKRYIVYYRTWPKKTPSTVALPAQKEAAGRFVSYNEGQIAAEYFDREKHRCERKGLAEAVAHAIRAEGTVVIPHLGRLARNVTVTKLLLESHVDFVCLDAQNINRLTIHLIAAMAEEETRKVSDRAKVALAAAKARGVKLGSADPNHWKGREHQRGTYKAIASAAKKKRERTKGAYALLMPKIKEMREQGGTLPEIVEWLNNQGKTTTVGKPFTQTAVLRLIGRYLGKEYLGNIKKRTQGNKVGTQVAIA
jgi:DNA invertase Pin-like site-specific DNA recombinase